MANVPGRIAEYDLHSCLSNALRANSACVEICTEEYETDKKEVADHIFEIPLWSMLLTITRAEDDMTLHDLHFFAQNFANNSLNLCWISKALHEKKIQFAKEFLKYHWPEVEEAVSIPDIDYSEIRDYLRSRNEDVSELLNCLPPGVKDTALSMWRAFCTFGERLMLSVKISAYYEDNSELHAVDEFIFRNGNGVRTNGHKRRPMASKNNHNLPTIHQLNHHHHQHHSAPPRIRQMSQPPPTQSSRLTVSFESPPAKKKIPWPFRR